MEKAGTFLEISICYSILQIMENCNEYFRDLSCNELSDDELICSLPASNSNLKCEESFTQLLTNKFVTAEKVPPWQRLSTGIENIDSILKGGIPFNGITEMFGCSGVGKTQIMLQLAVMIQLPKINHGKDRGVVYICTEDPFPAKRFHQLAEHFKNYYKLLKNNFEDNLHIDHVPDYEQLRRCLFVRLPNLLKMKNIGLIIIDSIAGVFRSENSNFNYTARGQDISHIADILHNLADKHNIAVVCTNQQRTLKWLNLLYVLSFHPKPPKWKETSSCILLNSLLLKIKMVITKSAFTF